MEVTMTTSSINHRPAPFIAAAAAVAAIAVGSVAVSVAHHPSQPSAPGQQSQSSVQQHTSAADHFSPTTSGGRVMVGE
jgi:NAD/NADP transhydrogenase alpha subunit